MRWEWKRNRESFHPHYRMMWQCTSEKKSEWTRRNINAVVRNPTMNTQNTREYERESPLNSRRIKLVKSVSSWWKAKGKWEKVPLFDIGRNTWNPSFTFVMSLSNANILLIGQMKYRIASVHLQFEWIENDFWRNAEGSRQSRDEDQSHSCLLAFWASRMIIIDSLTSSD
jgi:hypothetical protein